MRAHESVDEEDNEQDGQRSEESHQSCHCHNTERFASMRIYQKTLRYMVFPRSKLRMVKKQIIVAGITHGCWLVGRDVLAASLPPPELNSAGLQPRLPARNGFNCSTTYAINQEDLYLADHVKIVEERRLCKTLKQITDSSDQASHCAQSLSQATSTAIAIPPRKEMPISQGSGF
jgi:hypothetical protein